MIDMNQTIQAKSDQLNAEDLIGGDRTIKITSIKAPGGDQPIVIHYEGDNKKPYKPCKSMRRVLTKAWGNDGSAYVGRSMTLFLDPTVKWAGEEVGGIRISHLSHIDKPLLLPITVTRGRRSPWKVQPLKVAEEKTIEQRRADCLKALEDKGVEVSEDQKKKIEGAKEKGELAKIYNELTAFEQKGKTVT